MFVFPSRIAPASASDLATSLSAFGTQLARIVDPAVVRTLRVQKLSFSETGMPYRGLFARPRRISRSATFACRRAFSASTVRNTLSCGLHRSMRASDTSTRSTGEISPRRSRRAACSMEKYASSDSEWGVTLADLKNLFLMPKVAGRAQVRDADHDAVLIFVSDGAKRKPAVFEAEAATRAVVGNLDDLVLEGLRHKIVARAELDVEPAAVRLAVAEKRAYLIRMLLEIRRRGFGIHR